ncbi:reverse transcriptase, partial [Trifolium medium]|nr:reverse transcriptase [Trifolium medium]
NSKEAVQDKRRRDAMDREIKTIKKNDTWEFVSSSKDHKDISVKNVCKDKKNV